MKLREGHFILQDLLLVIKMTKIIINADDFGLSKEINEAVVSMYKAGNLTSASIMVMADYVDDAIEKLPGNDGLKVGLHFNITVGHSVLSHASIPLLVNEDGIFKNGFLKLLLLSIFKRKQFLEEVETELKAQISLLKHYGVDIEHIDSHRHIHYIFGVFKIVKDVASKEKISRVRIINESLIHTLRLGHFPAISGVIKWFVLRLLGFLSGARNTKDAPYFFSILHSCRVRNVLFQNFKLPERFDSIEIMLHPAIKSATDANFVYEKNHLTSKFRQLESEFIKPRL